MVGRVEGNVIESEGAEMEDVDCRDDDSVEGSRGRAVTCVPDNRIGVVAIGMLERAAASDWKDMVSGGNNAAGSDAGL